VQGNKEMSVRRSGFFLGVFYSLAAVGVVGGVIWFAAYFVQSMGLMSEPIAEPPVVEEVVPEAEPSTQTVSSQPATAQPLPVGIHASARQLSGGGYVVQVHNLSDKPLRVVIDMEASTTHPGRREAAELSAMGTIEIGWDLGWKLTPGDRVTITCAGFLPFRWTMP